MDACPSSFAWDDHEIHGTPFPEAVARHVEACPRCHRARERRQASRQAFATVAAAPLRQRMASVSSRRSSKRWPVPLLLMVSAGAAACLFVVVQRRGADSGPYVAAKGEVAIELAGRRSGKVFSFELDTAAEPGDELQLTIRAASRFHYVLVGSVDGTGRFSPFYPPALEGRSPELLPGRVLAPPIVLDDAPGPERIVIVLSGAPLRARDVALWAESAAGHPDAPLSQIAAAPPVIVRWVTLRKGSRAR